MKYNKGAILRSIEQPYLRDDVPDFDTGDTICVDYTVREGNRTRIQKFEGVVIARQNGKKGASASFTVRKVASGEGVERVFPLHSPLIDKLTVVRRGRTRRAKLYFLRQRRGKSARLKTDLSRQEADRAAMRAARAEAAKQAEKEAQEAALAAEREAQEAAQAAQEAEASAPSNTNEAQTDTES